MIGPVAASILVLSAGAVARTWNSRDRGVPLLASYVAFGAALSLLIHMTTRGASGRSSPMMLVDAAGLYGMGLWAVCRLDRPLWLYGLTAVTAAQCGAHLLYVADMIPGDAHTLALNLLFLGQITCLVAGRDAAPEDNLRLATMDLAPA